MPPWTRVTSHHLNFSFNLLQMFFPSALHIQICVHDYLGNTGSDLATPLASLLAAVSVRWKGWFEFWSKFSGRYNFEIASDSSSQGSECVTHATLTFSSNQLESTSSPLEKVIRLPLPTRRSWISNDWERKLYLIDHPQIQVLQNGKVFIQKVFFKAVKV